MSTSHVRMAGFKFRLWLLTANVIPGKQSDNLCNCIEHLEFWPWSSLGHCGHPEREAVNGNSLSLNYKRQFKKIVCIRTAQYNVNIK